MSEPAFLTSTRAAYDTVAENYAARFRDDLAEEGPLGRAMLDAYAELVREAPGGRPVVDVGCGPGRITSYLHQRGVPVYGVDLSPEMVAIARRQYPDLRFDVGSMTALDLDDEHAAGVVAWYSIIHIEPEWLPGVFAEFRRVLVPGGHLLLAFQVGDERVHVSEGYGHRVSVDAHRRPPERVAAALAEAGLTVHATLVREPEGPTDKSPQAYLLARRPAAADG